jgi:hypothetical protein
MVRRRVSARLTLAWRNPDTRVNADFSTID